MDLLPVPTCNKAPGASLSQTRGQESTRESGPKTAENRDANKYSYMQVHSSRKGKQTRIHQRLNEQTNVIHHPEEWHSAIKGILSSHTRTTEISRGPGKSWAGMDPHQDERFRSPEHSPQFSSCPQQGAPLLAHRRFSLSSLPPGSCFPTTNYRLGCIYISFHPSVNPLVCHSLRPSTEPDI